MLNSNLTRSLLMTALMVVPAVAANLDPTVTLRVDGAQADRQGVYHCGVGDVVGLRAQAPARSVVAVFVAPVDKMGVADYASGIFAFLDESRDGRAQVSFKIPEGASRSSFVVIAAALTAEGRFLMSEREVLMVN